MRRPRPCDPEAYRYDIDVAEVAEVWRRGSVVSSWLLDPRRLRFTRIPDSTTSRDRWRTRARGGGLRSPHEEGVPADVLTAALSPGSRRATATASRTASCPRCASSSGDTGSGDPSRGAPGRRGPRGPGGGGDRGGRGGSGGRSRDLPLGSQRRGDARPDLPPARVALARDRDVPGRRAGRPRGGRRPEPDASPRALRADGAATVRPMPVEADDLESAAAAYERSLPERFDVIHSGSATTGTRRPSCPTTPSSRCVIETSR